MAKNFTTSIVINGEILPVIIIPQMRRNGMHYEVNINNIPRFYVTWSALDRYDLSPNQEVHISDEILLAVSDAIEKNK
jgi:hypothetical protein